MNVKLIIFGAYLQVSEHMQADPVTVGESDDTQAHVGRAVVEVADEIHSSRTPFGSQQGIQFPGSGHLVGGRIGQGPAEGDDRGQKMGRNQCRVKD